MGWCRGKLQNGSIARSCSVAWELAHGSPKCVLRHLQEGLENVTVIATCEHDVQCCCTGAIGACAVNNSMVQRHNRKSARWHCRLQSQQHCQNLQNMNWCPVKGLMAWRFFSFPSTRSYDPQPLHPQRRLLLDYSRCKELHSDTAIRSFLVPMGLRDSSPAAHNS